MTAAEQVLDLVRAAGAQAEVQVGTRSRALTRFARSFIHQNVVDTVTRVRLRVVLDGSWAVAETDRTDPDSLRRAVDSALAAARLRAPDPLFPGLSEVDTPVGAGNWDDATADAAAEARAVVVREIVDATGGLETAGYVETERTESTYANSLGVTASGRVTAAGADVVARAPGSDGVARWAGVRLADVSGAALGGTAAGKARAGADPVDLPPGDYEVLLEPSCVGDILHFLVLHGLNGLPVAEGRSFASVGEDQFDPAVTLVDDPLDALSTSLPYDADGTARRRVPLVEAGRTVGLAQDRRTAARLGVRTNGHAIEDGERWGPVPPQLRLAPGTASLADVRRGLLVSDFWYTRVLDPRTVVVTGLTRNGVWLVEDGKVVSAVSNLRFTQSYPDALGPGNVLGVGADPAPTRERMARSVTVAPSLHLARWHMTGGAAG